MKRRGCICKRHFNVKEVNEMGGTRELMNIPWLVVLCPLYRHKREYWVWRFIGPYLVNGLLSCGLSLWLVQNTHIHTFGIILCRLIDRWKPFIDSWLFSSHDFSLLMFSTRFECLLFTQLFLEYFHINVLVKLIIVVLFLICKRSE